MNFFQKAGVRKFQATMQPEVIASAYERFSIYFHNRERQQNIRQAKEWWREQRAVPRL